MGQTLILATCEAGIWTDYPKPSESYCPGRRGPLAFYVYVLVYVPSPCSSSLGRADQNPEYSRVCWEPWFFPWSRSLCPWGWTLLPISFLSSWTSSSLTWTMHGHKDAATPPEAGTRKPLQRKGPAGCCFMSLKKRRRWGTAEKEIAPLHIQTSYKISGSYQL